MIILLFLACLIISWLRRDQRSQRVLSLCSAAILVAVALGLAWMHSENKDYNDKVKRALDTEINDIFIARACISIDREPQKWEALQDLFNGIGGLGKGNRGLDKITPCLGDASFYEAQIGDDEFRIQDALKTIREYNASGWNRHSQWWFLFWLPGVPNPL